MAGHREELFFDFRSIYQQNSQKSDKSDSEIRFVSDSSQSLKRITANGKVMGLADCLHLVDWGGTDFSFNKQSWGKSASGHRAAFFL